MDLSGMGRFLIVAGVALVALGGIVVLVGKGVIPRLPGDLTFGKGNARVYIPIGTSIVLSVLLTVILNIFFRR